MEKQESLKDLCLKIRENDLTEDNSTIEDQLIKNIEELSKIDEFYKLSLKQICSIISKVDFATIEDQDKSLNILQNIIKNTIKSHFEEKETILLLQNINFTSFSFSYEEINSLLELFTNCPILCQLTNLYNEKKQDVDVDYEYELQLKNKEIEKLNEKIQTGVFIFPEIKEEPSNLESDVFDACMEGNLESVRYLIETKNIDINKRDEENHHLIHIAVKYGFILILLYLVEKCGVDINIKGGKNDMMPIHYACKYNYLPIVEYLIYKGCDVNSRCESFNNATPLHFAAKYSNIFIVRYILNHGGDKTIKDINNRLPFDYNSIDSNHGQFDGFLKYELLKI